MSLLASVRSGKVNSPRRTFVYASGGVGKSTFGSESEAPMFIPTEDGLDDIECDSFPKCNSLAEVFAAIGTLYTDQHKWRTVVIDTVDWLEKLIWQEVCIKRAVETIEDIGFNRGYTFAMPYWTQLVGGLDALRNERGMAILLLAHAKIERFEDPENPAYDRHVPALHKFASSYLRDWCSEVFFANYKTYTATTGEGFNKQTKGIGSGERIMKTTERPAHVAKNRLNLPDEMPFSFAEYAKYFPQ